VGGARTITAPLNNQGIVNLTQVLTLNRADADHVNGGSINISTANLTVTQSGTTPSFTNTGTVALSANRTWTTTGGTLDLSAGTVSGDASTNLVVTGATLAFDPGTLTLPLTLNGGTTIAGGSVTIGDAETLTLLGGGLAEPVTIESGGTLVPHGTVSLTGALTLPAGGTLRIEGDNTGGPSSLTVANGFTNDGTIELTSAVSGQASSLTITNGTLVNGAAGVINALPGVGGARTIAAPLDNQGALNVTQVLTLNRADADHVNSGTIDLSTNNLTVTQTGTTPSFTNGGVIALGANRTWTVTGGTLDLVSGTVTGNASTNLVVAGATLAYDPPSATLPLTLNGGTTILGGAVTIGDAQTLTLLGGTLDAAVTVESGGQLVTHGTVSVTGALSLPGGNLRVEGDNTGGPSNLTVANGFTNDGVIELTSAVSGQASSLTVTNGTLTNGPGGVIAAQPGVGGARTLTAQLDNQGSLDVDQTLTINRADADHVNSGLIDLSGANLTLTQSGTSPTFINTGTVNIQASRTFTATGGTVTNANAPALGVIQGAGTLNVSGTTFSNAGDVRPGNALTAGTLTVTGNYPQSATGALNIELGGTLTTQFDRVLASGAATLGGTLNVTFINGFTGPGSFIIMTFTGTPADFATKNLPGSCTGAPTAGQYVITCL
jgi:hypothetical protein